MRANPKYAVFILTHGRPETVLTYGLLRRLNYKGKIYLICDDEDKALPQYIAKYGDQVIVFSKREYEGKFDIMDNFDGNKVIVYARNACYDIARRLGLDYFFEYEDDYTSILHRWVDNGRLRSKAVDLSKVFPLMINCLQASNVNSIAFAQGGDYMGGVSSNVQSQYKRKAMNSFLFRISKNTSDDIQFVGRMNDDVNTYLLQGQIGKLFFTIPDVMLTQRQTQKGKSGNSDAYKEFGTYVKSFYSVMAAPSCCKISMLGTDHRRVHHKISWNNAVPKVISEALKKHA